MLCFMFLFVPLSSLLFLCWLYITWARQKIIIINTRYISIAFYSLAAFFFSTYYFLVLSCFVLGLVIYALNPIVLQVVMKVYLSYWIILFNTTVVYLLLFSHYSFTFTIDYYIMEVVNIRLNCLTWLLVSVIILVSSCVILCSIDYLSIIDCYLFLILLFLFQFFMIIFVISNNFIVIFICWDWLGLVSYCLINFWSSKTKSGIKAVVYNKVGDIGLIIVLCLSYSLMPIINYCPVITFNFLTLNLSFNFLAPFVCLFLLIAQFTKSAQLPFSAWLIWAMAAPTPTSALLHSSTMVIAGVYLSLVMHPLFSHVLTSSFYLCFFFAFTLGASLFWSVFKAIYLSDIKSIIAFSTISQISYMFIAMFCSAPFVCLFHIIVHAFFKSCLFLIAGSFIHVQHSFQSVYKLKLFHSFTSLIFILAGSVLVFSLSKEGIIYSTTLLAASSFYALVVVLGGIFTMIYTMKIYNLVFCSGCFSCFFSVFKYCCAQYSLDFYHLALNFSAHFKCYVLNFGFKSWAFIYSLSLSFILPWLAISSIFIDQSLEYMFFSSCSLIYYSIDSYLFLSIHSIMDYSLVIVLILICLYFNWLCVLFDSFLFLSFGISLWSLAFNLYSFYFKDLSFLCCFVLFSSFSSYLRRLLYCELAFFFYNTYLANTQLYFMFSFNLLTFDCLFSSSLFLICSCFYFKCLICLIEVYTGLSCFFSMFLFSFYLLVPSAILFLFIWYYIFS